MSGRKLPPEERYKVGSNKRHNFHHRHSRDGAVELQAPAAVGLYHPHPYIERSRASLRSRGSLRSSYRSYSSSPRYSARPLEARIKNCCRLTIAFIFSNVGVCGLFVGYTIMGSFLFQVIS